MAFPGPLLTAAALLPGDEPFKAVCIQRERKKEIASGQFNFSVHLIPHRIHVACFYFLKDNQFLISWSYKLLKNRLHVFLKLNVLDKIIVSIFDVKKAPSQTPSMLIFVILGWSQNTYGSVGELVCNQKD